MKKIVSLILVLILSVTVLAGCGGKKNDGKVHITIAAWPVKETNPEKYELYQSYLEEYKKLYPDVVVETDEWTYDLKNYLVKAAAKQLPTTFTTAPTELDTLVNSGYIKDLTSAMNKFNYLPNYDENYANTYLRDGKAYAVVNPSTVYQMGLMINVPLFKKAGLVNEDGSLKYPQTWDEVVEFGKIIKEKTGAAGFVMPSKNRHGGWEFLNIAWSYGADFIKQTEDGKYKAIFNSDECAAALQLIKDMKWEHNILPDNSLLDLAGLKEYIGTGKAAMGIIQSNSAVTTPKQYGTSLDDLAMCRIPAGPEGRFAMSSASIYVISGEATDEEVDAVMNWFNLIGMGPEISDEMISKWEADYKTYADEGEIVGIKPNLIWKDGEIKTLQINAMNKYKNVDPKLFEDYSNIEGITFRPDPEKCAQQLYDTLDSAIQEILTNKNANVKTVLKEAEKNFQLNFLDKE